MTLQTPPGAARSGSPRIFPGWWMVLICMVGLCVCQSPIAYLTLGVFLTPLSAAFGWGRGAVSFALSVSAITLMFATPLIGRLIDRVGARPVILASMLGFGMLVMSLSLLRNSLLQFYGTYILIGIIGPGANYIGFMRVVSLWFRRRRGLAFGIAATGVALGIALWPALAQVIIVRAGWRTAYLCLGALVLVLGLPIVALFLKESPADLGLGADGDPPDAHLNEPHHTAGLTVSQALHSAEFRILTAAAFMMAMALNGTTVHFVPLMVDRGLSSATAAHVFSVFGVGIIVSRLSIGPLLDKFFGPHVAILAMSGPLVATLLLIFAPPSITTAVLSALLLSVGAGAELEVLGYLSTRYVGLRSFSEIYGYVFGAFMAGTACAPYLFGLCYDTFKSYEPALAMATALFATLCLLFSRLRAYPSFAEKGLPAATDATATLLRSTTVSAD